MPGPHRGLGERHGESAARDVLRGREQAALGGLPDERLEAQLGREVERRRAVLGRDAGDARVLAALEAGTRLPDEQDRVARRPERRPERLGHVVEQPDDADLGRRGDPAASRFVVQRHVPAGHRQAERATRVAEAAHRLGQLPERVRLRRIAVVEAVRDAQRPRPGDRDVARRLGHAHRRAQPGIGGAHARVAVRRRDERLRRARHADHRRAAARRAGGGRRLDGRVVLLEDGAARGEIRRSQEGLQHGAGIHAALRQLVARDDRRAGRGREPAALRRRREPLEDDGVGGQRGGRDAGDLARTLGGSPSASRPPSTIAMSPSAVTRPMTAHGRFHLRADRGDRREPIRPHDREHPLLALADHHLERRHARLAPRDRVEIDAGSRFPPDRPSPTSRR